MLQRRTLDQPDRRFASAIQEHYAAMTEYLGRLCPGENVMVAVYSARSSEDIERWGGKHLTFEWNLGTLEHEGRREEADDDHAVFVLISYGENPTIRYRCGESGGWVSRPLPTGMR